MYKLFILFMIMFFSYNESKSQTKIEAENWTAMSGVSTEGCTDVGGGLNVNYIDLNDWMQYSYTAPSLGNYTVRFRVATPNSSSPQLQLQNSAGSILATLNIPNTGGWQNWQDISATVSLPAGTQTLKVVSTGGTYSGWNFNYLEFSSTTSGNQAPTVNPGVQQNITLPTSTVTLTGVATDADGTIASYAWTKFSGPAGDAIVSPTASTTVVNGLVQGTYVYRLTATDNGGATSYGDITVIVNAAVPTTGWSLTGTAATATQFLGTTNAQDLVFKANNHSWARLTTMGVFEANKIKVRADSWADYVFAKGYTLMPLSSVNAFIEQHKHLPNVPSEKEVLQDGINLAENQALLLRKIEELTLYLISQDKKIEVQAKQIERLKAIVKRK
jgi:hypothetical protein